MIKIEAPSLEQAYRDAASSLSCSVTELTIEVVQAPTNGFLGLFKKSAIIVAALKPVEANEVSELKKETNKETKKVEVKKEQVKVKEQIKPKEQVKPKTSNKAKIKKKTNEQKVFNETIMPESFVSTQDDEDYDMDDINFTADYDEEEEVPLDNQKVRAKDVALEIEEEINKLFKFTCFSIDKIDVSAYDEETLLVEFKGEDAALLIGKEGYRYKALSYMIFNWINTKYKLQLRLEIAEFLKNQEESVGRYLVGVKEGIERDGRAQTKILDGVLVQIALKDLRDNYPNKYVAIRTTRDGLKFIIVNDYHSN